MQDFIEVLQAQRQQIAQQLQDQAASLAFCKSLSAAGVMGATRQIMELTLQQTVQEDLMLAQSIEELQKGNVAQAVELLFPTYH